MNESENTIPVAFLPAAIDACALFRQFLPHLNIANTRFLYRPGTLNVSEFSDCKVAVVQRQVSVHNLAAMQHIKQQGIKIVYDLDDNVWNLPSANPGKRLFDQYKDGFGMCAKEADVITVSTQGLQTAARSAFNFKKEIVVCPNGMDFNFFHKKPIKKEDNLTIIGWAGSNTHREDLIEALSIMPQVLEGNPESRIEFVGAPPDNFRHKQMRFRTWVPVGEFANRMASWAWDISIAPLAENRFNRSKSCIKMLEAASLQIPCLVSDVQPYNEFCSLGGEDLKWLLCSTAHQWKTKLRVLLNEPERRSFLGQRTYEVAKLFYDMKKLSNNWRRVFEQVLQ